MGQFQPGNNSGRGGARPGAGRKPAAARKALDALLNTPFENGTMAGKTLIDAAMETIADALGNTDEIGNVTGVALRAATDIVDRQFGKARQTLKLQGERRDLAGSLAAVAGAIQQGRMRDIFKLKPEETRDNEAEAEDDAADYEEPPEPEPKPLNQRKRGPIVPPKPAGKVTDPTKPGKSGKKKQRNHRLG